MTTKHGVIEFVAGDDWEIQATLLDELGNPYDLSGNVATIKYVLFDEQHNHLVDDEAIITIMGDPKEGNVSVIVPSVVTSPIPGGLYNDALRLTIAGETGTLLIGLVSVIGDPWQAPVALTQARDSNVRALYLDRRQTPQVPLQRPAPVLIEAQPIMRTGLVQSRGQARGGRR